MKASSLWRGFTTSVWLLIALGYLVFFVTDLQLDFAQTQVPCSGAACNYLAISSAEINTLQQWGWSARGYALLVNGATVLTVTVSWLLGGLILWRQGGSRIGWSVSLALIAIPVAMISDVNNVAANHPELFIPSQILSTVGIMILLLFLYTFPNGRFYPRWAFIPLLATVAFLELSPLQTGGAEFRTIAAWVAPLLTGLLLTAVGFQILRYRRVSTPVERQQVKWILLGLFILVLGFPVWFLAFGGLVAIPPGPPRLLASMAGWIVNVALLSALPLSLAVAILRYRLWDIDLIVRRTLIYSVITAMLALVYFGAVVVFENALRGLTGSGSQAAIVLSTLLIAALFGPLRARVQREIDRRFYRRKYDAARTLAAFGASVRDDVDLDALGQRLTAVVEETMQPATISLWAPGKPQPPKQL